MLVLTVRMMMMTLTITFGAPSTDLVGRSCYMDLCTYQEQYCSHTQQRCVFCTKAHCLPTAQTPEECKKICPELLKTDPLTSTTVTTNRPVTNLSTPIATTTPQFNKESDRADGKIVGKEHPAGDTVSKPDYLGITNTVLLVILVIIIIIGGWILIVRISSRMKPADENDRGLAKKDIGNSRKNPELCSLLGSTTNNSTKTDSGPSSLTLAQKQSHNHAAKIGATPEIISKLEQLVPSPSTAPVMTTRAVQTEFCFSLQPDSSGLNRERACAGGPPRAVSDRTCMTDDTRHDKGYDFRILDKLSNQEYFTYIPDYPDNYTQRPVWNDLNDHTVLKSV